MNDNVLIAAMQAVFNEAVQTAVATHITQLQQQHANVVGELATKVAALEIASLDWPAGQMAQAEQLRPMIRDMIRAELVAGQLDLAVIAENVDLSRLAGHLDKAQIIDALDQQEWFWNKLKGFINENTPAIDLEELAANIDMDGLASHVDLSTLAGELTGAQLNDIANDIDLDDLASELDAQDIADKIDIEEAVRDFFQNNTFSIRP